MWCFLLHFLLSSSGLFLPNCCGLISRVIWFFCGPDEVRCSQRACVTVLIAGNNFKIHFFWHLKKRKPIGVSEIVSKDLRITTSVPCIMGKAFFFWSKTHILKIYLTTLGLPVFFAHHETLKAAFILKCKKRRKQTSPSDRKDFAQKMDETDRMHVKCEQPPMEQPCLLFSFRGPKARGCCSQSSHVLFS